MMIATMVDRRLLLGLGLAFVLASTAAKVNAGSEASQTSAGRTLLLSPVVHRGQALTWTAKLTNRTVESSPTGPQRHFDHLDGLTTCTVMDDSNDSLTVSRVFAVTS